ncbi:MAG: type II toxin-antitoxin system VapC family toxin [Pseudomonadota bacterium]
MRYVLDNSVAMRWLLSSQKATDQHYAEAVLHSMLEATAVVPQLWHLEAANVLLTAEKRGELTSADVDNFVTELVSLPIRTDNLTAHQVFGQTLGLARTYHLSSYDAAYLELAIREKLLLATLDKNLIKAAGKAGVGLYLVS